MELIRVGLLILITLLGSFSSNAQLFDDLEKTESINDSKTVLDISIGTGFQVGTFEPNDSTPSYLTATQYYDVRPISAELFLGRRLGQFILGGNLGFDHFQNRDRASLYVPTSFQFIRSSGQVEYVSGASNTGSINIGMTLGLGIPLNAPGTNHSLLLSGSARVAYLLRLSDNISFDLSMLYKIDRFSSRINEKESVHSLGAGILGAGLRFGI